METRKAEIMSQFNSTELTPEMIEKLGKELSEINDTLEEKEMRWLELAELA